MKLTKIDLACTNPAAVAKFCQSVLDINISAEAPDVFTCDLGGVVLTLVSKTQAGVEIAASGTQQIHLRGQEDPAVVAARAESLGAKTEVVDYARGVCIWDPEGNPWIITR